VHEPDLRVALFGMLLGDAVRFAKEWLGIAIATAGCGCSRAATGRPAARARGRPLALLGAAPSRRTFVIGRRLIQTVPLLPYLGAVNGRRGRVRTALAHGGRRPARPVIHRMRAAALSRRSSAIAAHRGGKTTPAHLVSLRQPRPAAPVVTWARSASSPR
jgi:hypothetical protein